jgi:ubiquinone/menaquinone biosynthesis C-methylase UbiE
MSQQVGYTTFGRTSAENYQRYFVPVIPTPLAADLIETAAPRPGEHVLDVACGTGVLTRLAAQRVGTAGRVVGVDLTPEMLQVARSIPAPSGAAIEWRQGDAQALPLPDEAFDLALCQLGLMFAADRQAALREMRRVLSSGGRVAINVPGAIPPLFEIMARALGQHIAPDLVGFVGHVFSLHDPSVLGGLLNDVGFNSVTVNTTTKTLRLPPPADFLWQYIFATPLADLVAAADDKRRQRLEDDVVGQWQDFVERDSLVIKLPVIIATASR